jgi:transposase
LLTLAAGTKVYLASAPVDLRRGHDGLGALVRSVLAGDPYSGHLFVFVGRRGDRVKVLYWDRGGFVVHYKRLAKGRFLVPRSEAGTTHQMIDGVELGMLLGGFDLRATRRAEAWERSPKRPSAA